MMDEARLPHAEPASPAAWLGRPHPGPPTPEPPPRRPIRPLPPEVAARIAAGEVIERPASVVKELVENALDAGARDVRIEVRGAGLSLIRVRDDGIGIPRAELALACQRHATSKLAGDLAEVRTLGFRGEALPSIAAVAELTIVSAVDDSGVGHRLTLRDGRVVVDEPAPHPRGTTVTVRHLFQSVPVRLAALGRRQTEAAQIGQVARRLALAAPAVRVLLELDGRPAFRTSGSGDLAAALVEVYGPALAEGLVALEPVEVAGARLAGVVAGPDATRPGRGQVHVIVNGRWVQPRGLMALLEAAYRPVLPRGRHPIAALTVETAPAQVDVNVHPAKLEVRLRDERAIGAALGEMVRDALARRPRALRLPAEAAPPLASLGARPEVAEEAAAYDERRPIVTPGLPPLLLLDQLQGRLLLLEGPDGLYLVDQHRAHERVIYERLTAAHGGPAPEPVALPEPLVFELRPSQLAPFGRRLRELEALGFHLESFGGRSFLLRAAPPIPGVVAAGEGLAGLGQPSDLMEAILGLEDEPPGEGESWRERLLVRLACRAAVRRGRALDRPAMRGLVEALGHTRAPAVCPHGSPLLVHVSSALLERQFDWR